MIEREQISLVSPPVNFALTTAEGEAAKRVIFLEDLVPAGDVPLFDFLGEDVAYISRVLVENEMAGNYPADCAGQISLGVDPGLRYCGWTNFPVVENGLPNTLKFLGALEFTAGHRKWMVWDHNPPIAYRKGDGIVIAPVIWGNFTTLSPASVFIAFNVLSDRGDFKVDPRTAFQQPLHGSVSEEAAYNHRSLVPITKSGTRGRIHVSAQEHGCDGLAKVSIGVQASGPNMVAAPVPVTFGGLPACPCLPPNRGVWSDEFDLDMTAGQSLLINFNLSGAWGYRAISPYSNWYATDADSHASAAMLGTVTHQANRGPHCVDAVQVWTP